MAEYQLKYEFEQKRFDLRVEKLKADGVTVELTVRKPRRTLKQNDYLHYLLTAFAFEYGDSMEYVKQYLFKQVVNPEYFKRVVSNEKRGYTREEYISTRKLTTEQMSICTERFRNWSAKQGIYLPEPNEEGAMQWYEEQAKKYRRQ